MKYLNKTPSIEQKVPKERCWQIYNNKSFF